MNTTLMNYVEDKLGKSWSPQQISGRLLIDFSQQSSMRIRHKTIYRLLYEKREIAGHWELDTVVGRKS